MTSERSHPVAIDVDQTYDKAYHSRYEVLHSTYDMLVACCSFSVACKQLFMACYDSSRLVTSERSHPGAIDVDQTYDRASYSRYEVWHSAYDMLLLFVHVLKRCKQLFMAC